MPERRHQSDFEWLLRRSSLGTRQVRRLAERTSSERAREVLRNARGRDFPAAPGPIPPQERTTEALTTGDEPTGGSHPMAGSRKTSAKAAKAASKVLRDGRSGRASKTAAGSALSQRAPRKGSK